jgi:hypothetical protein
MPLLGDCAKGTSSVTEFSHMNARRHGWAAEHRKWKAVLLSTRTFLRLPWASPTEMLERLAAVQEDGGPGSCHGKLLLLL